MELDDTQARLKEEREAREASEVCVKALKEFITENAVGDPADGSSSIRGLTLPPLPTEDIPDTPQLPTKKGWGLSSLWGSGSSASPALAGEMTPKGKAPPVHQQSTGAFGRWRSGSNTSTSTGHTDNSNSNGHAQRAEDHYTPTPTRGSASRRVGMFGSVSSVGSVSVMGHSPPRSIGSTTYPPSLVESGESVSGASSEGPDSPDPKLAATLEQERVEIVQAQEAAIDNSGLVRPDASIRLEKMSGEMTPTGDQAGGHLNSVTMIA